MKKDLIHAVSIFIFYNCMACFSIGNGVCQEIDLTNNTKSHPSSFMSGNQYTPRKLSDNLTGDVVNVLKELQDQDDTQQ